MNKLEKLGKRLRPRWWFTALVVMVLLVTIDTIYRWQTTAAISWGRAVPPPLDSSSPSGYADNQHMLVLPYSGIDGYHWVMQTQQMLATGEARIRKVDYDNAPEGREVHWASALRWWMAGLAWLDHAYTGTPLPLAVEEIAPYASTLLVVLLIALITPVVARRFGSIPAALFALGPVGVWPYYESFTEGRLDHHGLAALNALLTVLFLAGGAAGWVSVENARAVNSPLQGWLPNRRQAQRWFIAAGITGGIGLWISAASEAPVLLETGIGALLATGLLGPGPHPRWWVGLGKGLGKMIAWSFGGWGKSLVAYFNADPGNAEQFPAKPDPSLWRVWGWSGAATSGFLYLVEYFPAHFGMRLEVNHPLYALAWAGGGELIFRLCRWWNGGQLIAVRWDWAWLAFSGFALAAIPALIYLANDKVFRVSDHFLWVMHNDYIEEFVGLGTFLKSQWKGEQYWVFFLFANPLVLLTFPMVFWSGLRRIPRPIRALLLLALPSGFLTFCLSVFQVRWTELNYSLWLAVLVVVALALGLNHKYKWSWSRRLTASVILAWGIFASPAFLIKTWVATDWKSSSSMLEGLEQVVRDSSQRLRTRVGDADAIVLSGPTSSTWLSYYGGFKTVGSYYWENLQGLKDAAAIYGANYEAALPLLQARHVTHVVIFSFVDLPEEYAKLARGLRSWDPTPEDAFVVRMQKAGLIPQWLRPLHYGVPEPFHKSVMISIYEVKPQQSAVETLTRLAQLQMDEGRPNTENLLLTALKMDPNYLPAFITLGRLQLSANQLAEFSSTFQKLRALLPLADKLELGDRVDLVAVLSHLQDGSLMRAQLQLALREATGEKLRTLRPDSLYNLLNLSRISGLLALRPAIWPVGLQLLPPSLGVQLLEQRAHAEITAGHSREALASLQQALTVDPHAITALSQLALFLCASPDATLRDEKTALATARQAYDLDQGEHADIADILACAYAGVGDFANAVATEEKAIAIAQKANAASLTNDLAAHLELFKKRMPFREP